MDVRIGVTYTAKEIELDLGQDASKDDVQKEVETALNKGNVLWLTDRRGRVVGVPADKIAYVEVGAEAGERRIGFIG